MEGLELNSISSRGRPERKPAKHQIKDSKSLSPNKDISWAFFPSLRKMGSLKGFYSTHTMRKQKKVVTPLLIWGNFLLIVSLISKRYQR